MHARDLVDAARRAVPGDGPAGRRAHRGGRRPSCATAITSRSRSSCTQKHSFSDNWIYVHDPDVEVGRVQNYGSWSPFMVKEGRTCLGLEFFVNEGDAMWTKPDDRADRAGHARAVPPRARRRRRRASSAGYVVRMPKAYPVYDEHYQAQRHDHAQVARRRTRPTCSRAAATACTSTTTRTTRCSRRCCRSRTSSARDHDVWARQRRGRVPRADADGRRRRSRRPGRDAPVLPRRALDDAAAARGRGVEGGCRRPVSRSSPGPTQPRVRTRRMPVR